MLDFKTGAGVGRELYVLGVVGDALMLSGVGGKLLEEVKAGDEVMVDNSRYLAFCHHYRHQVDVRYPEERESMLDGAPLYPQRPQLERLFSGPYTYDLGKAKIIMVSGMTDRGTWPSSPVSYRTHLAKTMGVEPEQVSRIWYNERQQHVDGANMVAGPAPVPTTQFINYGGSVHEALRQLTAWVEEGKEPLPSSKHDYTLDSQVILAETAAERRGIQPLVRVTGNGKAGRVEVKRGEPVTFVAVAEAPPGAGRIVSLEWDFEGRGDWPVKAPVDGSRSRLEHSATHAFAKPGVYFPACRVVAHWNGAMNDPNFRLPNLGRIRVVVA